MMTDPEIKMTRIILCQGMPQPLVSQRERIHQLSGRSTFSRQLTFSFTVRLGSCAHGQSWSLLSPACLPSLQPGGAAWTRGQLLRNTHKIWQVWRNRTTVRGPLVLSAAHILMFPDIPNHNLLPNGTQCLSLKLLPPECLLKNFRDHRIKQCLGLEGTFNGHLVQPTWWVDRMLIRLLSGKQI